MKLHDLPNSASKRELVSSPAEYADEQYEALMSAVDTKLVPNHEITYVAFTPEQAISDPEHFTYAPSSELPEIMSDATMIVCISRDEELDPEYDDHHPDQNIRLTPSAESNVDRAVELYKMAKEAGNEDIRFIVTGRMHNRAIKMMLALPLIAEQMGINAEDAYHITEARFKELLYKTFTDEKVKELMELENSDQDLAANHKALKSLLDGSNTADVIFEEYKRYPRISTSELMRRRAIEAGVSDSDIFEEDAAVDTISNVVNLREMVDTSVGGFHETDKIVTVAGSDHLPRTTWITDHVLPNGPSLVFVESDPRLDLSAYDASCDRERLSFGKGSNWIGGTRNLQELNAIVEAGYFGANYKTTEEIARDVAAQAVKDRLAKEAIDHR